MFGKKEKNGGQNLRGVISNAVGEILIIEHNEGCHAEDVIRRLSAAPVLTAVF